MSEEIEKLRKREIEERSGWCPLDEPMPVKPIPGSINPYSNTAPVPGMMMDSLCESERYVEQYFPAGAAPGLALGMMMDSLWLLGRKRVVKVRVYFDE